MEFSVLEVMVVVSNQGTVHYMRREENYDLQKAAKQEFIIVRRLAAWKVMF